MMLILTVVFPILYGALLLCFREGSMSEKAIRRYAVTGLSLEVPLLVLACFTPAPGAAFSLNDVIRLSLRMDPCGRFFAWVILIVWLLAGIYSLEYMKHEENNRRYFSFYLMSLGVLMGLCASANLYTFYLFYELMTLSTFVLVLHNRSREALMAALKYLFYSFAGAYMVLFGIYFLYRNSSDPGLTFTQGGIGLTGVPSFVLLFMILGFSVKAGCFPMHGWLPTAHPVAPAPASAVLSGIIVKAGVLGIIRTVLYLFGQDAFAGTRTRTVALVLSVITIFMGSMLAYREPVLKKRLAYSTVSQVSYILFGIFAADPDMISMKGAMLHVAAHAMIKSALFLIAGAIIYNTGCTRVEELRGIGRKMPVLMWCYTICSLGLIGIPPFGGFTSKWYLALGALSAGGPGILGVVGVAVLLVSALLTAGYLLPISIHAFLPGKGFSDETAVSSKEEASSEEPVRFFAPAYRMAGEPKKVMLIPILLLTVFSVLIGLFPEVLL